MRRRTVLTLAAVSATGLLSPRLATATAGSLETGGQTGVQTIAPGVLLERTTTPTGTTTGPARQSLLRLAAGSSTRPVLLQQSLSAPRTPAVLAATAGAVAAVNGDFFDIDRTGTPDGPVVRDGEAVKASAQLQWAVGIDSGPAGWSGRIGAVLLEGSATVGGRPFPLAALGTRTVPADSLALFSPAWGAGDRLLTASPGLELEVRAGLVTAVRNPGATPVPADGFVLVATGSVAAALQGTATGTSVTSDVRVRDDALAPGSRGFALGARLELVRDGVVAAIDTADPTWAALRARTAIGWTRGGDLLLLTVEGGTSQSVGATAVQTAQRMVEAGALGAVMLDGGGSAQMVARLPGDAGVSEVVVPSDGFARPVAHVVGLVPAAAGPEATAVVLRSGLGAAQVFPGLSQTVRAVPVTASGAPTDGVAHLISLTPTTLAVETTGRVLVRGVATGRGSIEARLGTAVGRLDVEVLTPLASLEITTPLTLATAGSTLDVTLTGRDASGRTAPVDVADVRVGLDASVLRAEPLDDGRLRLVSLVAGPVSTTVHLAALGVSAAVPAAVGTRPVLVDPLDDPTAWPVATIRAKATTSQVPGPDAGSSGAGSSGGSAVRLTYDFTGQPAGTTTAALVARTPVRLPAGATGLALQVRGDGAGGWLRGVLLVDGASRPVTFAARVDFTGWRRLEVPVPTGSREVAVERIYLAQTSEAGRRAGAIDLAALEAAVPPLGTGLQSAPVVVDRYRRQVR